MKINPLKITTLLAGLLVFGVASVRAASITNADASVTLNLGGSWVGGTPPGPSDVSVWDNTVQINATKALGANLSWGGIRVLDPAGLITISAGNTLTLGASGIDLSAATNSLTVSAPVVLGANQTWLVTNGLTLNVGGGISGSGWLTLNNGGNDGGTVVLPVANTYTGGTLITSGMVVPGVATSFGTAGVTNNTGTLLLSTLGNGIIIANTFTINGTTLMDMNNRAVSQVLDGAFSGSGTIYLTNDTASGSTLTLGGNGSGGGSFSAFTGSLLVASNASGTASAGTIRFNNGGGSPNLGNSLMTLDLGNGSVHFTEKNSLQTTSFGALYGGASTELAQPENYVIGGLNLNTTFAGTILGASSLTKNGTGTLTLTGNNPYTGTTTVNAGILQVGDGVTTSAGALGTGAISIGVSGKLLFNKPDGFTVANNISGAGALIQTNLSTLTYNGTDTASGTFTVSQGDLALGGSGVVASPIALASGAVYDVSGNTSYTLSSTLSGSGTVFGLLTASGGTINPGSTGTAGTLTFSNGLSELGNINNQFELSTPAGTNDLISIAGDLTLTGTNNIILTHFGGGNLPVGTYPLINYSGNFNGNLSQFAVTVAGVKGTLSNPPNQIAIIISPNLRGATNLTWVGDGAANNWDATSSNWVNGVTYFNFLAGDSVIFDNTGLANSTVDVAALAAPTSVLVNSTGSYSFTGNFGIADSSKPTILTKTNSGTLSISATNSYTGPTVVGGGTLQIFYVANGGSASAIGAANSDPSNLVFYSSEFAYAGSTAATDRGATLNGSGATFDVVSGSTLTENGTLTGPGALTLVDSGTLTLGAANSYTGGTVISNGILAAANDTANSSGFGPTNSPVTFYGGTLTLFNSTRDDGSTVYSFFNPLVVPAGQTGTLNPFERGNVYGALTGGGVLNIDVASAGYRAGFVGNWSAFTGTINITGDFRVGNPWGYSNAVINVNDSSDLAGGNAGGVYSTSPIIDIGELDGTSVATIGANSKPAPFPTWRVGWKNTTSTFAGTIETTTVCTNSIVKVGTGILILEGQNTYSGSTTISNGVLALVTNPSTSTDASISDSSNIYVNTGAFLDVSGISTGTLALNAGQVICGNGTLRGILDNSSGGIVSAGDGLAGNLGMLTVTNNVNLGGTTWLKLNRADSPNSDRLVSSTAGIINFESGTLVVTNVGGNLHVGDTFKLFSAATLQNSFNTIVLPDYYTWNTANLAVNGTIAVTGTQAPPVISSVDFSQLANGTITLNAINGVPNSPVSVLSTTNLALPLGSWTNLTSTTFDANGDLSQSVTVDPTLPQNFFQLQAF